MSLSSRRCRLLLSILLLVLSARDPSANVRPPTQDAPATGLLLIASMNDSRVDIIDESTTRTLGSVNTGKGPHEVRVAPDGRTAYVVAGPTITAIDLATRSTKRTFDLGEFSAHDVRLSRDGRRLWAACARQRTVLEIDADTGAVLKRHPTNQDGAWFVEVDVREAKLYTPNLEGKSISVITPASGQVKVLPLDYAAYGIDITPDGRHVLVSGRGVAVIDTGSDTVARTIPTTAPDTGRIRITPDGRRVAVAMAKSLDLYEIASGRLLSTTPLPASPKVLALSGDGRRAFLTNPEEHSATIVDLDAGRVLATLRTGAKPDGIAWAPKPE